jgi:hypothetical protein
VNLTGGGGLHRKTKTTQKQKQKTARDGHGVVVVVVSDSFGATRHLRIGIIIARGHNVNHIRCRVDSIVQSLGKTSTEGHVGHFRSGRWSCVDGIHTRDNPVVGTGTVIPQDLLGSVVGSVRKTREKVRR